MNPIFAHRILPFGIATFGTDRSESVKRNLQIKVNLLRQVLLQQPIHNNIYNQTIQNINVINPTPKDMNLIDNAITNAKQSYKELIDDVLSLLGMMATREQAKLDATLATDPTQKTAYFMNVLLYCVKCYRSLCKENNKYISYIPDFIKLVNTIDANIVNMFHTAGDIEEVLQKAVEFLIGCKRNVFPNNYQQPLALHYPKTKTQKITIADQCKINGDVVVARIEALLQNNICPINEIESELFTLLDVYQPYTFQAVVIKLNSNSMMCGFAMENNGISMLQKEILTCIRLMHLVLQHLVIHDNPERILQMTAVSPNVVFIRTVVYQFKEFAKANNINMSSKTLQELDNMCSGLSQDDGNIPFISKLCSNSMNFLNAIFGESVAFYLMTNMNSFDPYNVIKRYTIAILNKLPISSGEKQSLATQLATALNQYKSIVCINGS